MTRIVILALLLAGCAQPQYVWQHPAYTQDRFAQDRFACLQASTVSGSSLYGTRTMVMAMPSTRVDNDLFRACMEARGWTLTVQQQ